MLLVNSVVLYGAVHYRILSIQKEHGIWIDINRRFADPEPVDKSKIGEAVSQNYAAIVDDPFMGQLPKNLTSAQLNRLEKRWAVMKFVNNNEKRLHKHAWPALYEYLKDKTGTTFTKKHIYELLRKFLQRGQNKYALLPDFNKQGAPKKARKITSNKVGRKRTVAIGQGIPVDENIKEIFRSAIEAYYLKATRMPWRKVLEKVESEFRKKYPHISIEDYPTVTQLNHFFKMNYQATDTAKLRNSQIDYEKDVRALKSTATAQVSGPGDRFEFDATIIDLYLVSENEPSKIIGRPTLLLAIDVFSRLVTGYYLTFEPPSYVLAMMCIANCLEDKVDVCKSLGISIESDDWPALGLPSAILADKGELLTHQADSLVNTFNVRIENAKARRGDAKGIVEQQFRTLQAEFVPYTPGAVTVETAKKRGGNDYRLGAELNLRELEEIIVLLIYKRNLTILKKYDADDGIPNNLPRTPKDLWLWGIENRSGLLKSANVDDFKIRTLPRDSASVSNEGIKFQSLTYSCQEAFQSGWFLRDSHRTRPRAVSIAFDPRNTSNIFVFPNTEQNQFWVANITDRSRAYSDMTFYEATQTMKMVKLSSDSASKAYKNKQLDAQERIEKRLEAAKKRKKKKINHESASSTLKKIKDNKKSALADERQKRSVKGSSKNVGNATDNVKPFKKPDSFEHPDISDDIFGDDD